MATYDYSKIDPILKENPDITWNEFKNKYPKLKMSNWSFHARKAKLQGLSTYGNALAKTAKAPAKTAKASAKTAKAPAKRSVSVEDLQNIVDELLPQSTLKDEYVAAAQELIKDPTITHSHMRNAGIITMSDAGYYSFRRKLTKRLNGYAKSNSKVALAPVTRKKSSNTLYKTIYEKEVTKSLNPKSLDLLKDFVEHLNNEKLISAEVFEIISPRHVIEIRSYSR